MCDAELVRVGDRLDLDGLPPEGELTASGRERAADDLVEGGLAGAVVADQREDLAGPDLEARTAQCLEVAEMLR